jgi:hypothetical protein
VQNDNDLRGDVYAVTDQPIGTLLSSLQHASAWCDLLMLHLNVKSCTTSPTPAGEHIDLVVGRKFDQPLQDAYDIGFAFKPVALSGDYFRVEMTAPSGPLSTHDYHLALEAIPLDATHAFVHMTYSYGFGIAARLAMQGYLATLGRDKVGFSTEGLTPDGHPLYIGGVRAVVERNTMRYFLAIETYLSTAAVPAPERLERRLTQWFDESDRYPQQLHEMSRAQYLDMKHHEFARLQGTAK